MRKWLAGFLLFVCLAAAGCTAVNEEEKSGYQIWYINQCVTRLEGEYRELNADNT